MNPMRIEPCPRCHRPHLTALMERNGGMCPLCQEQVAAEEDDRATRLLTFVVAVAVPLLAVAGTILGLLLR